VTAKKLFVFVIFIQYWMMMHFLKFRLTIFTFHSKDSENYSNTVIYYSFLLLLMAFIVVLVILLVKELGDNAS